MAKKETLSLTELPNLDVPIEQPTPEPLDGVAAIDDLPNTDEPRVKKPKAPKLEADVKRLWKVCTFRTEVPAPRMEKTVRENKFKLEELHDRTVRVTSLTDRDANPVIVPFENINYWQPL